MATRFYHFIAMEGREIPEVALVVSTLNESYVRDTTAIGLLDALSERLGFGVNFAVICDGDYRMTYHSLEYFIDEIEISERSVNWLQEILGQ